MFEEDLGKDMTRKTKTEPSFNSPFSTVDNGRGFDVVFERKLNHTISKEKIKPLDSLWCPIFVELQQPFV